MGADDAKVAKTLFSSGWLRSLTTLTQHIRTDIQRIQYILHHRRIRYEDGKPNAVAEWFSQIKFKAAFQKIIQNRYDVMKNAIRDIITHNQCDIFGVTQEDNGEECSSKVSKIVLACGLADRYEGFMEKAKDVKHKWLDGTALTCINLLRRVKCSVLLQKR